MLARNGLQRLEAQTIEVGERVLLPSPVDLVHGDHDGALALSQDARDLLVEPGQPGAPVHHEDDEVGLIDGEHDLGEDRGYKIGICGWIEAAYLKQRGVTARVCVGDT